MSFSIDLRELNKNLTQIQRYINQFDTPGRFVVQRITAYATLTVNVTPSPSLEAALSQEGSDGWHQAQKALDWQPDQLQLHDRDEIEVLHYLKLVNGMNPYRTHYAGNSKTNFRSMTTSLHGTACAEHEVPHLSSFRRHLWRCSLWERPTLASCRYYTIQHCSDELCRQVFVQKPCSWASYLDGATCTTLVTPRRSDASISRAENWVLELDVVDRYSPNFTHTWKRPFIQTSHTKDRPWPDAEAQELQSRVQVKRFNGTRYREDRKRWLAETRVPNHKHKISFGTFKSEEEAARAVDAAFHYYNKPHHINFPDSPLLMPQAPGAVLVNENEKLSFVKEQAQRMANLAFAIPEPPCQYPIANEGECPVDLLLQPGFSESEYCSSDASAGHRRNAVQITEVRTTEGEDGMSRLPELLPEASLQLQHSVLVSKERRLTLSTMSGGGPGLGFRGCVDLPSLSDDCFDCLPDDPFLHVSE